MDLEDLRLFLPKYLSPERQNDLWNELRSFPNNRALYSYVIDDTEILQGDGWRGFIAIDFYSRDSKVVSGLVLSNSCDVSIDNRRAITPNIAFAPLVRLEAYVDLLRATGYEGERLESTVRSMRSQETSSLMYFPSISDKMPESIALLGDVRSHPLDHFTATERSRIFRLSDFGFYLFLFKLSIHFTRMNDGAIR